MTASHAIFHTEDKMSAPVAVVGYQFQHSALLALFQNITSNVSTFLFVPEPSFSICMNETGEKSENY